MHTSLKLKMLSAAAALVIGGGVAQADYADTVLNTPDLLAYYRLQETSAVTPVNAVAGSVVTAAYNTGTTANLLTFQQPGPITNGTAVRVKPGSSATTGDFGFLDVNTGVDSNGDTRWNLTNYTAEMWIRPQLEEFDDASIQYVFTRTDAGPNNQDGPNRNGDGIAITGSYNRDNGGTLPGTIALSSSGTVAFSEQTLDLEKWYHLVLTRSGDDLTLYIKELLEDGTAGEYYDTLSMVKAVSSNEYLNNSSHAAFGARRETNASHSFSGDIAEVALYNRALGEEEVMAHFGAVIPEPGSLLLLGAGATMMLYRRRTVS